jgi:hypothetical protein
MQKTLAELVNEAKKELRPRHRLMLGARMLFPGPRRAILENVRAELMNSELAMSVSASSAFAVMGSETFDAESSPFNLDVEMLRQLLDLIIEYLPKILALFNFTIVPLFFALSLAGSSAMAQAPSMRLASSVQHPVLIMPSTKTVVRNQVCTGPQCKANQPANRPVLRAVTAPVRVAKNIVTAAVPKTQRIHAVQAVPQSTVIYSQPMSPVSVRTGPPVTSVRTERVSSAPVVRSFGWRVRAVRQRFGSRLFGCGCR